jgi:hypothetical protein
MIEQPQTEREAPMIYALDRRGPNDPSVGSIHIVLGVLLIALSVATMLVL